MTWTATAAYPYVNLDRATCGLRGQLREIAAASGAGTPDWSTLVVEGPVEFTGAHGRSWLVWTAEVEAVIASVKTMSTDTPACSCRSVGPEGSP